VAEQQDPAGESEEGAEADRAVLGEQMELGVVGHFRRIDDELHEG